MSYNNSDKEYYYALYIKLYKEKLENILNLKLESIELDKNFAGRKIDLFSFLADGRKLFLELQLNKSDNIHLEQLKSIIKFKEINNVEIVWIALEFSADMLSKIEEEIKLSGKNIRFTALRLNEQVIPYLHILNKIFINNVIGKLCIMNEVENHFSIEEIFYRQQNNQYDTLSNTLKTTKNEELMKNLLVQLREEIYYYPSIHRDKKLNNNVIVLAGGKSDINYYVGINKRNYLYVEIRFGLRHSELFELLLDNKEYICKQLDYLSEYDVENTKIGTYIYLRSDKIKLQIKQIARITDRYLKLFSPYLYPNKFEENNISKGLSVR